MRVQILSFFFCVITHRSMGVLRVRALETTLPFAMRDMISVYDGDDSIYLFGGYDRDHFSTRNISKFTISTETIRVLNIQLPVTTYGAAGSACMDSLNSEIFLISSFLQDGVGYFTDVIRLPTTGDNQTLVNDGRHRIGMPHGHTLCDTRGRVFNVNYFSGVFRYHQNIKLFERLLPNANVSREGAVVYEPDSDSVYMFGGVHYPTPHDEIVKIIPGPPATIEVMEAKLPEPRYHGVGGWDGKYVWVSAGLNVYYHNFYRFDPETGDVATIQATGFPEGVDFRNEATASVYVPKANAIYFWRKCKKWDHQQLYCTGYYLDYKLG